MLLFIILLFLLISVLGILHAFLPSLLVRHPHLIDDVVSQHVLTTWIPFFVFLRPLLKISIFRTISAASLYLLFHLLFVFLKTFIRLRLLLRSKRRLEMLFKGRFSLRNRCTRSLNVFFFLILNWLSFLEYTFLRL